MTAILFVVSCLILVTGATRNSSHLLHRQTRQQSRCTYTHTFRNVGEWINLRSEGYPNSYYPNLDCRYTITSPKGTVMRLECPEFNLRYGNNCPIDKFFWSRSGDPNFRDWRFACGTTPIKDTSTSNVLTLGFISSQDQPLPNNKFGCKVTVDPATCSQPCGMSGVSNRIVNGVEAQVSEFPHRCAIYSNRMGLFCACAIISEWYAMTAAHCLDEIEPGEQLILDFGDHDVTVTSDAKNVLMNISSFTIHPEYDTKSSNNDIALIRFQKSITFTNNIRPVCLPFKFENYDLGGATCTASGWGIVYDGGPQATKLRKINVQTLNSQSCQQVYGTKIKITDKMICAGGGKQDTCQGDSGGSLDYWDVNSKRFYAFGVVSFGPSCGLEGSPGIYTDVTKFLSWIEQVTQANFCKM